MGHDGRSPVALAFEPARRKELRWTPLRAVRRASHPVLGWTTMAKRARTERREAARDAVKMAVARMKLAALEPGGAEDRPIEVTSASIIEPHASSMICPACGN